MKNTSEREKMLSGKLYNANDKHLLAERKAAKDLCFEYNRILPSLIRERKTLIKKILGKTGKNILVEQPFYCDYGGNIEVGENFFSNFNVVVLDSAKVIFGDHVLIGPNCGFYTVGHPFDIQQRNDAIEYAYPITVGHNVWIGAGSSILPGVKIGDNSIIGAGSVVTRDIPENVLAVGNPCRVIREI